MNIHKISAFFLFYFAASTKKRDEIVDFVCCINLLFSLSAATWFYHTPAHSRRLNLYFIFFRRFVAFWAHHSIKLGYLKSCCIKLILKLQTASKRTAVLLTSRRSAFNAVAPVSLLLLVHCGPFVGCCWFFVVWLITFRC